MRPLHSATSVIKRISYIWLKQNPKNKKLNNNLINSSDLVEIGI